MHADVLLVTVTPVESKAVLEVFEQATGEAPEAIQVGDRIYRSLGIVNQASVFLAQSGMGAGSLGAAQQTVQKGIDALSPAAVIMVGIAFGVNAKTQSIGDVLVSHRLMLYDPQRAGTDEAGRLKQFPRGARPDASPWLFNRFQNAQLDWKGATVRIGPILSGEKLVANVDFRRQLLDFGPEAVGGEMEGAGLYAACHDRKVDWILVKAISDWADGRKSRNRDKHQRLAAHNAARFVLHMLKQAPLKQGGEAPPAGTGLARYSSLPHQFFFCGREHELKVIADTLSPESRGWGVLIDGPGGIGKTALAIRAGYLAPATDFPIKILLSAKVRELTPAGEEPLKDFMLPNFMVLLSELATELGENDAACAPPNERANAVRRILVDKRALIVIDNLETFVENERVRLYQFLTRLPATCKAIVTSRRRAGIDAKILRLDKLPLEDSFGLVTELARSNRPLARASEQERQGLCEITQGNPLLIRWVAGQLERPGSHCRTIAEASRYLKSGLPGNDPLEFIFGDLLDTFTDDETAVLAALTHFTQPAKVEWIADMAGLAHPAAQTALEGLADRALLVSDDEAHAFLLPTVAATFLRRKRPEAVNRTGDRLANHAYALATQNGYQNYGSFFRLEAEWPALAAALPLLTQGSNARLQTLDDALIEFLHFSGRWEEWLWLSKEAEEKALAANDFFRAGYRALQTGWIYHLHRQAGEVLACAARSEAHWQKARAGAAEKAAAIQLRGLGHRVQKDYAASIEAFKKALALDRAFAPESEYVSTDLNHLGEVEQLSGAHAAAKRHYSEALRISKAIDHREDVAKSLCNLAWLALDRKNWSAAESQSRDSLRLSEVLGSQEAIGRACRVAALAIARQGRRDESLPYARRATDIFTKLRMPDDLETAQAALKECREGG